MAKAASKKRPKGIRLRLPDVGEVFDERYRIDAEVNGGTYGVVYSATDLQKDEHVAVKCLLPSAATSMAVVRRFEREIQVIRALAHPNLISILNYGLTKERCLYYVMEFLDGLDLGGKLKGGVLPPRGAALVTIQVLMALEEAHSHDIIHRDLKPENVFLQQTADGRVRVRVLDFGIAKVVGERGQRLERLTLQNEACGTPNYMAPEQITGDSIGPWTDLYALGLIMYEMLTGEMAVDGGSFIETLRLQTSGAITLPDKFKGNPIFDIVQRVLEKKPENRYKSATLMKHALTEAMPNL